MQLFIRTYATVGWQIWGNDHMRYGFWTSTVPLGIEVKVRTDFAGEQSHVHFMSIQPTGSTNNPIHIDFIASNADLTPPPGQYDRHFGRRHFQLHFPE